MTSHLHILLLASALVCASCRHVSPEQEAAGSGRQGNTGALCTEDEVTAELRKWFDPLLQRSFPGWVRTAPLVFDDLFWNLHADKREQWHNPYNHGSDVVADYETAWKDDLAVFKRIFPRNGPGYRLSVEGTGDSLRIVSSHNQAPSPQPNLPFDTRFANPSYQHPPEYHVPPGEILRVDDGWLVCHNDGEFGAWLYWYSNDGKNNYEVAPWAWVNRFFCFGQKLFAIGGLSHLSGDSGTVFELAKAEGRWKAVKTIQLAQEAHLAAPMTDTSFIVVCTASLVEVSLDGSVRYLYGVINVNMLEGGIWGRKASWMCYGPKSAVVHAEKVWIGTTFGAIVVRLRGWDSTEEWLVPESEMAQVEKYFGHPWQPRIPTAVERPIEEEPANQ